MTLMEVMNRHRVEELKAVARRLGLPKAITRKADIVRAVGHYLDEDLEGLLGHLSDQERWLFAEAAHQAGRVSLRTFAAKYGSSITRASLSARNGEASLPGVLFDRDEVTGELCLPQDLAQRLRGLLPKPPASVVNTVDPIPAVLNMGADHSCRDAEQRPVHVFEGEKTVFAELRRVLNLVQAGKVRIQDKSRRPTGAAVRLLTTAMVVPDFDLELPAEQRDQYTETAGPVRAHAWGVLVQQCGWAKARGSALVLTKAGKDLLSGASPAAFREGFQRFVVDDRFDELNRINHIRGQTGKAKRYMTPPSLRRDAICESMGDWPLGQWIAVDEAFRFLAASGRELDVTDAPYYLYFAELQYGSLAGAGDDIERQYLRACLMESLATLGIVDIAYVYPEGLWPELGDSWGIDALDFCGRYDGLLYVRLSSLGAYCLGIADDYEPPAAEQRNLLKVLANRELAVSGSAPLSPADRASLELFAKQTSDHLWSLDPQRILDYVESGGAFEDVTRFLTQNSGEAIPHTVEVFLNDLAGKLDAVRGIERAILVEMADAEVAARVAHDRRTKSLCRLAAGSYAVVPEKNEQAFRSAMKKLGYIVPR